MLTSLPDYQGIEGSDIEGSGILEYYIEGSDIEGSDIEGSGILEHYIEGSDIEGSGIPEHCWQWHTRALRAVAYQSIEGSGIPECLGH